MLCNVRSRLPQIINSVLYVNKMTFVRLDENRPQDAYNSTKLTFRV